MTETAARIILLGPQRRVPSVRDTLDPLLDAHAPVAAITAGWEERESEHLELGEHLDRRVDNLELHRRAEDVFQRDPELFAAVREHHDNLRELQRLYRMRLRHLLPAAQALLRTTGTPALVEPEREAALANLRALDDHHVQRVGELQAEFIAAWHPIERDHVARHRHEIVELLRGAAALCVAGGHVGVLFNRLWLFDVMDALPVGRPIVAWSAGAMALSERIVLFHDSPPEGKGRAELLGPGLGICRGIVPLPHAHHRLRLDDSVRVQLLARRYPDALCVALEEGDRLHWDGGVWVAGKSVQQLQVDGTLAAVGGAV